jgi:methionyl-tRNA formyltransferase
MGSPEFALPTLRSLSAHYQMVGVVTQPDRPAGRGQTLTPSPIKKLAIELNLPIIQPVKLRAPEGMEQLIAWKPDLIVVAAYGQILRQNVLDLPTHGCINVHASLLPRWRGASPIQAAIASGDEKTGVTIMKMDAGIDTGDVLAQVETLILPHENAIALEGRLAEIGSELLMQTLPGYIGGEIQPMPQPSDGSTYAPMLKKEDGELDFNESVMVLERKVLAYQPWPGAFVIWGGNLLKINAASILPLTEKVAPGLRSVRNKKPVIAASDGLLVLDEVQPQGKKSMAGTMFLNGARNWKQF